MSNIEEILDAECALLRLHFDHANEAREHALRECREIIRGSSKCIRAVHRHEFDVAEVGLEELRARVCGLSAGLRDTPAILYSGYVHDAVKEYAEAATLYGLVHTNHLPSARSLGVEPAAWLNGLAEATSECRRYILDELRAGNDSVADALLSKMDAVYSMLITFDYPDALTGGLRRTTDAFRAVLERTRSDLTLSLQQRRLERLILRSVAGEPTEVQGVKADG